MLFVKFPVRYKTAIGLRPVSVKRKYEVPVIKEEKKSGGSGGSGGKCHEKKREVILSVIE
jgi:hypothetical protein